MTEIDFIAYFRILLKYKKLVVVDMLAIVLIAVILSLLWPKKYVASSCFIPSFSVATPFSEMRNAVTPDLALLLQGSMPIISDTYAALLKTRTAMESVIKKNHLQSILKRRTLEETIDVLDKISSIEIGEEQIITLKVSMSDPHVAAKVVNDWVTALDSINRQAIKDQGIGEISFIGDRLNALRWKLDTTLANLADFAGRNQLFSVDESLKTSFRLYAEIVHDLYNKQIELMKWTNTQPGFPIKTEIENEIKNIKTKLKELTEGPGRGIIAAVPFKKLPLLLSQYRMLEIERDVALTLYSYLLIEYEIAFLKAHGDEPTIVIIDEAKPPEKRDWPTRTKIVIFSFGVALFFNLLLVLILERVKLKW